MPNGQPVLFTLVSPIRLYKLFPSLVQRNLPHRLDAVAADVAVAVTAAVAVVAVAVSYTLKCLKRFKK